MRTFLDVIALWPTSVEMARDLHVRDVTVRAWRARGIPAHRWQDVARAARRRGFRVTLNMLASMAEPNTSRRAANG